MVQSGQEWGQGRPTLATALIITVAVGLMAPTSRQDMLPVALASSPVGGSMTETLIQEHNRVRQEANVPPLTWSTDLATSAQQWADHLASTDTFAHSNSPYGENLWKGTAGAFSLVQMVGSWEAEESLFLPGVFPNVSSTGDWADVGHYTQMIWSATLEVGCGLATGHGYDVLVCQYAPPGNVMGQRVMGQQPD